MNILGMLLIAIPAVFCTALASGWPGLRCLWVRTPADGCDVLMYAQTLTRSLEYPVVTGAGEKSTPNEPIGGPALNLWTGILTGLGSFWVCLAAQSFYFLF
jgi:hypothetical protein